MPNYKPEGGLRRWAECFIVECNLNVSIFGKEFNIFIKTVKNTSNDAFKDFVKLAIWSEFFIL